jgi:hypothetical protein
MNDLKFFWRNEARATVVSFWNGRGWVIMSVKKDLRYERGDGENRIGIGE